MPPKRKEADANEPRRSGRNAAKSISYNDSDEDDRSTKKGAKSPAKSPAKKRRTTSKGEAEASVDTADEGDLSTTNGAVAEDQAPAEQATAEEETANESGPAQHVAHHEKAEDINQAAQQTVETDVSGVAQRTDDAVEERAGGDAKSLPTGPSDAHLHKDEKAALEDPDHPAEQPAASTEEKAEGSGILALGESIPDVTLHNEDGEEVNVSNLCHDTGIVIFSYPKASTGGCTTQALAYRNNYEEIKKRDYEVFGLSTDRSAANKNFKDKQQLPYHLLSDPDSKLIASLGAGGKKSAVRSHWVFAKGGILKAAEIATKPKDCVTSAIASIDRIQNKKQT